MTSFYYYDQDPSGFRFLVLIKAFVIQTLLGLQNLNMKGKTKRILVEVVKWRHRANGLFELPSFHSAWHQNRNAFSLKKVSPLDFQQYNPFKY